jgi:oligoendopeptidase F
MAHEMGHAFHSKFSSENQTPLYRNYTIVTAEVASTFFENFVFDEIFPTLSKKEQVIALHDKINSSIQTIFRQVACFNFELELHNLIREKGSLAKEEIAKLMNKHMKSYLGPLFKMEEVDGYFFVSWSHLRYFFYVYSYAFGEIVSSALYSMYKKDSAFEKKIRQFLYAGASASPEEIFANIGINVKKPEFFEEGLRKIEKDIEILEKLAKDLRLIK